MYRLLCLTILIAFSLLFCPQLAGQDLMTAIQQGNIKTIEREVKKDPSIINQVRAEPILLTALRYGQIDAAVKLVDLGAKIDGKNSQGQNPLHLSAMYRNSKLTRALIEKGVPMNDVDNNGYTPLVIALHYGNPDSAKDLINAGCSLTTRDRQQMTPLHTAINARNQDVIQLLLDKGSDMFAKSSSNMTPYMAACQTGQLDLVKKYFDRAKAHEVTKNKQSCLLLACYSNSVPLIEFLCEQTNLENQGDEWGQTPIIVAANNNNLKMARVLLKHKADPNSVSKLQYVMAPLLSAVNHANAEMVNTLVQAGANTNTEAQGSGDRPLHLACRIATPPYGTPNASRHQQIADVIKTLLAHGADPNAKNKTGQTPLAVAVFANFPAGIDLLIRKTKNTDIDLGQESFLHWSCKNNMPNTVSVLLDRSKATINQPDRNGQTPLNLAAATGNPTIVELLLKAGAKVNQVGEGGQSPLHSGLASGSNEVVQSLIDAGANLTLPDGGDRMPLHIAAWHGNTEAISLFGSASVNMTPTTQSGSTPLHLAAWQNHIETAKALLAFNVDIDRADADGWSPLHKAAHRGHLEMVKFLLENGADKSLTDSLGLTAMEKAGGAQKAEILKLLK